MIPLHLRSEEIDPEVRVRLIDLLQGDIDLDDSMDDEAPGLHAAPIKFPRAE